jgi:hypothetical protein
MKKFFSILCIIVFAWTPGAQAADADAVAPAHLDALVAMLQAIRVPETVKANALASAKATPANISYVQYMASHVDNEALARAMAPAYAPHISFATATQLTAAFNTPLARKVTRLQMERDRSPTTAPGNLLNPKDRSDWNAFYSGEAARTFIAAHRKADPEMIRLVRQLIVQQVDQAGMKGLQEIAARAKAWLEAGRVTAPVLFIPEKTGIAHVDQFTSLVATSFWRNTNNGWKIDAELKELGFEEVLLPTSLVTPEKVAKGRFVLDEADAKLAILLRENQSNIDAFRVSLAAIDMPNKEAVAGIIQRAMERNVDDTVRYAENQRAMLGIMRRVLAFAESRMGKLTVKNGVLQLPDDADVALYNGLVAEAKRESARFDAQLGAVVKRIDDLAAGKLPKVEK